MQERCQSQAGKAHAQIREKYAARHTGTGTTC
jgi:hypothetical protein